MAYVLRVNKSSFQHNNSNYSKYINFLTKRLEKENLRVTQEEENNNITLLRIGVSNNDALEKQAEEQGFYKPTISNTKDRKTKQGEGAVRELNQFVRSKCSSYLNYKANEDDDNADDSFWYPCEKLDLVHSILHNMRIGDEDLNYMKEIIQATSSSSATPKMIDANDYLLYAGEDLGIIMNTMPLHESGRQNLFKETIWKSPFTDRFIQKVYQYYGSKVALYFAWLNHFTIWLCLPGLFGGFIWCHNYLDDEVSIDNSRLAPYYTIFVICWAVLFVQYWKRKCACLTCGWGTISSIDRESNRIRCAFHGEVRICTITGKEQIYYPYSKRLFKYAQSMIVTSGMLCVAFNAMVLSLNLQGYIHSNSFGASWLHFPVIQQFSEPGRIFDPNSASGYWTLIPTILHAFTINTLNSKYRSLAVALTEAENHKTEDDFENALIMKRFFFEAFDSYIALFFLAFIQCDIVLLRSELVALYTADSIRRVVTECIIPLLMQLKNRRNRSASSARQKKDDDDKDSAKNSTRDTTIYSTLVDELEQDEYEQFDDYLEMVIQFGYVTLFASAFPLSGLLSIICNFIEIKSDLFKLTYVVRRPDAIRTSSIGTWLTVMQGMVWISIMTNVFIFAFTTEQMMQLFPNMFTVSYSDEVNDVDFGGSDHVHAAVEGKGRWVVGVAVVIEHVLFLLAGLVFAAIPDKPSSICEEMKRREYAYALFLAEKKDQK